ncbi:MAG: MgtC/SapB family protein [Acidimicrobiia bacterium]
MITRVSDGEAILRIAIAGGLGFLIGIERLLRSNPAGPRTFSLLAMGAAAFAVVAAGFRNDGRVIAGVATGVGFIGAGMIWHDSARGVVGFATAASSWAAVAIGVMSGLNRELVAVAFAGMCVLVLELQYAPMIDWLWRHRRDDTFSSDVDEARYGPLVDEPSTSTRPRDADGPSDPDPGDAPSRPT